MHSVRVHRARPWSLVIPTRSLSSSASHSLIGFFSAIVETLNLRWARLPG